MTDNIIQLIVNGQTYTQFKSISVSRSLDAIGGSFVANVANRIIADVPIKLNDDVKININGQQVLQGYVVGLNPSYSTDGHNLEITGVDQTSDIVDCSVWANCEFNGGLSMVGLFTQILNRNGVTSVKVKSASDDPFFKEGDIVGTASGESLFSFLDRLARKKNRLLTTDGRGNLLIYSNSGEATNRSLVNIYGDNTNSAIISASSSYDNSKRFAKIIVRSQTKKGDDLEGSSVDKGARSNRTLLLVNDTVVDSEGAAEIAAWEVNKRKAEATTYNCQVFGYNATISKIWQPNQLIFIRDDYADVNGKMLLKAVTYTYNESVGSVSDLTFVAPNSYSLQITNPSKADKLAENV